MYPSLIRSELGLLVSLLTAIIFMILGGSWLSDLSNPLMTSAFFLWIFIIMLWSSFGVVRHADALAIKLGEPYGTLILTLSVISIEVTMISAVMLTGSDNPTLGRDMMFAVLMIVLNGLVGLSILLGGIRHVEQEFNLQGANAFLSVLIPLAILGLLLPNFTQSTSIGTFSTSQMVFVILATIGLYISFLGLQTLRHRKFFIDPVALRVDGEGMGSHGHEGVVVHSALLHTILLLAYMIPIVLLSKKMAVIVDFGIAQMGAPAALGGFLVAILVLAPEGMAAFQAALANQLQRSINICLGSALATIGLTVPAVLLIGIVTGEVVVLGLNPVDSLLLATTLAISIVNFSSPRTNMIQGLVHLILFVTYCVLIFD